MDITNTRVRKNLPDWYAVLDFLASLIIRPETHHIRITRKDKDDWQVELNTKRKRLHHKKQPAFGAGLYDLYW